MAKSLGNANKAFVKVSSSLTWLSGEQNNSVNVTAEAIEVSDKSTEWAQFISGKKGATLEITLFADNADSAQTAVLTALTAGTEVDWAVGPSSDGSAAPTTGWSGKGIITSVSDTNDFGAVASRSISITATGAVSHS